MAKQNLRGCMNEEKVKGFVDVLVTHIVAEGLSHLYVIFMYFSSRLALIMIIGY